MTVLRKNAMAELERVPEDKLEILLQFITKLTGENETKKENGDLEQFIMPSTERGKNADEYVRGLRDDDRI